MARRKRRTGAVRSDSSAVYILRKTSSPRERRPLKPDLDGREKKNVERVRQAAGAEGTAEGAPGHNELLLPDLEKKGRKT